MVCGVLIAPSVFSNLYLKDVLQYVYELSINLRITSFRTQSASSFTERNNNTLIGFSISLSKRTNRNSLQIQKE